MRGFGLNPTQSISAATSAADREGGRTTRRITNRSIGHGDHLAHDRDDHDLVQLTSGLETIVERLEHWIPIARAHRRHVKHVTNWRTTAPDAAFSLELAALEGIGRDADEGGDLFTAHAAELGQERDQGAGQDRSDPRHGSEESVSVYERGIGSYDLDQGCVQHIDISFEPADTTTRKPQQHRVFQHRGGILGGNLLIAELAANSQ